MALAIGRVDVDQMLSEMSARQYQEWRLFFELEPWGSKREDMRAGTIGAAVCNSNPFRRKGSKTILPSDLFESLKVVEAKSGDQWSMATNLKVRTKLLGGEFKTMSRK